MTRLHLKYSYNFKTNVTEFTVMYVKLYCIVCIVLLSQKNYVHTHIFTKIYLWMIYFTVIYQ